MKMSDWCFAIFFFRQTNDELKRFKMHIWWNPYFLTVTSRLISYVLSVKGEKGNKSKKLLLLIIHMVYSYTYREA